MQKISKKLSEGELILGLVNHIIADRDVAKKRLAECNNCEYYNGLRCSLCGCVMRIKAKIDFTKCPIGKWDAYTRKV